MTGSGGGFLQRLATALTTRRGSRQWDAVLRGTGVVGLVAIYPTLIWPEVGALAAFLCITIFVNGPMAPLLPATYEPIQVVMGRVYPPLLVALIGVVGTCYIEFINYYLYRWMILNPRLERARNSRLTQVIVALFRSNPFLSIWLCALTPLPYWVVRFLGPLTGYPIVPYILATFLGRLPRYYLIARFGRWLPVSDFVLTLAAVVMIAVALAIVIGRWIHEARRSPSREVPMRSLKAGAQPAD